MKRFKYIALPVAIIAICFWVYLLRHPGGAQQFECAFGIPPPTGVQGIIAYRRWAGGPGDRFVLLRFNADRAAIEKAVAFRPLVLDPRVVEDRLRSDNDWPRFWRSIFTTYFDCGGAEWAIPAAFRSPEYYHWRDDSGRITTLRVLWDADEGTAFALYTIG